MQTSAASYEKTSAWWRAHPTACRALRATNTVLTALGWVAYPLLLVLSTLTCHSMRALFLIVPCIGFFLCTLLRIAVNEPRPYEQLDIEPLIVKDTRGKSFPSRHIFSMAMIAVSWLCYEPVFGTLLCISTLLMAYARVVGGVHFAHDVAAGALLACIVALVGYALVPLLVGL